MKTLSLLCVFALVYIAAGGELPNLSQRASSPLHAAISKSRKLFPVQASGLDTRSGAVTDIAQILQNNAESILQFLQQTAALSQQYAEYIYTVVQHALIALQGLGDNIFQYGEAILQQLLTTLSNSKVSRDGSARIPWLIQLVINALTSSAQFQGLVAQDPVVQCIEVHGIECNTALVIGLMENNQALDFLYLPMVQDCLTANGGMQNYVQTSPVVGWAWTIAGQLSATEAVTQAVLEHLGHDLGSQVNQWLLSRPKTRFVDLLDIPIHLIDTKTALLPAIASQFAQVETVIQNFIHETIGQLNDVLHLVVDEFVEFLKPLQQYFPTLIQQITTQLNTLFSGQLDSKLKNKKH
ncbi:uncharacterized protein LOC129591997 [Paramacrobiotus metropolitanus]|uniref:uncharacterized protein LOC129591997 n=1 Tax=Paramacrobiotus metropolitanus TaxID=2943436 RepID=UPI002446573D|nr:uncharacterized protein LOC129591997 [Paramacrobiotus metropolitanus]